MDKYILDMISEVHEFNMCKCCKQMYREIWIKYNDNYCHFCNNFLPLRDTKTYILNGIEQSILQSGFKSRYIYYKEFLIGLNKWCNHWSIYSTDEDLKIEETLMKSFEEYLFLYN